MNELISYQSANGLRFGDSPDRAEELFGTAKVERHNREGELEKYYDDFIMRFSQDALKFRECTVPFNVPTRLNEVDIDWTLDGFISLCEQDGEPLEFYGSVILFSTGVSLTGIEESAESDRTLTVFARGDWDAFRSKMKPFRL